MALSGPEWEFPVYVGHRRRVLPTDDLFLDGSYEHDDLSRAFARAAAKNTSLHEAEERSLAQEYRYLAPKHECNSCRAILPTAHLLDLHIAEVHDSFFAAQAARCLPVYACLVESCDRKFCSIQERKQHLVDFHKFPGSVHLDTIHLARHKKGQVRPLPGYRKQKNTSKPPLNEQHQQQQPVVDHVEEEESEAMAVDDEHGLTAGMSRLRMSAELSHIPRSVGFGQRGRKNFMPGLLGKGGGGGGSTTRKGDEKEVNYNTSDVSSKSGVDEKI